MIGGAIKQPGSLSLMVYNSLLCGHLVYKQVM